VRPLPKAGHEKALFISSCSQRISGNYVHEIVKKNAALAGITRNVYPHKLRITNITHMAEVGLSISEIQAQSGHLDTKTLIGYIQHTASRIRKGYDRTFNDLDDTHIGSPRGNPLVNSGNLGKERYRKIAFRKYLDGEIDNRTLHSIFTNLDNEKNQRKQNKVVDLAYQ